jgi:hypothetical protein
MAFDDLTEYQKSILVAILDEMTWLPYAVGRHRDLLLGEEAEDVGIQSVDTYGSVGAEKTAE